MGKVILSKKEIEALESALAINGRDKSNVISWHAVNGIWEGSREALNDLDLDTICSALYVGYEVESDSEDKILELYEISKHIGVREGIFKTINLLEMNIKGINC